MIYARARVRVRASVCVCARVCVCVCACVRLCKEKQRQWMYCKCLLLCGNIISFKRDDPRRCHLVAARQRLIAATHTPSSSLAAPPPRSWDVEEKQLELIARREATSTITVTSSRLTFINKFCVVTVTRALLSCCVT